MHNPHNCYGRQLSYVLFHECVPGCHMERSLRDGQVLWETRWGCSLPSAPPPKKGNSQRKHMSRTGWSETWGDLPGGVLLSAPEGKQLTWLGTSEIMSPWTAQIATNQVNLWIPYNSKKNPLKTLFPFLSVSAPSSQLHTASSITTTLLTKQYLLRQK